MLPQQQAAEAEATVTHRRGIFRETFREDSDGDRQSVRSFIQLDDGLPCVAIVFEL